jgi:hypothetical protein
MEAGQYGFAAVGTHQQVIALRDAVIAAGGSFAITRAVMAERFPDGRQVVYEGSDPGGFREQARSRLGFDPAEAGQQGRWELAHEFVCPARVLDVVLHDYSQWPLRS